MDALDDLITRCREAAAQPEPAAATLEAVRQTDLAGLADAINARPQPWFFCAEPSLSLFATSGRPGSGSAPHDHGLWAVIACLAGREGSRLYEAGPSSLHETGLRQLDAGESALLSADAVHAVFNCWNAPNLVLHVYGGDFLAAPKGVWDPITGVRFPLELVEPLAPLDGQS